jgi:ankyrin repeat protein
MNYIINSLLNAFRLKKTNIMADLILRFPHIVERILDELNNGDLVNCRKLSKSLRKFIDMQKLPWIRMIKKYSGSQTEFLDQWKQVTQKTSTLTVKKLAIYTKKFFEDSPERQYHQWSPHFIVADQGGLEFYKDIAEKTECINPRKLNGESWELDEFVKVRYHNRNFEHASSALDMAVIKGQLEICKFIMNANKDNKNAKTFTNTNGVTTLHLAARYGHLDLCRFIIQNLSDKSPKSIEGWTPFHEAASSGHLKVCKFLMEYVSGINAGNNWGVTAIHLAAKDNHLKVCKLLIENGADVVARTNRRKTPLHGAAQSGALSTCRLLMENMEAKNPQDFDSWTPYQLAAMRGHLKVCKLFKDNLGSINYDFGFVRGSPLHLALENGHLEVCKLITDNVEDKDLKNKHVSSFLYLFMVLLLLENKVKIVVSCIKHWPVKLLFILYGYFMVFFTQFHYMLVLVRPLGFGVFLLTTFFVPIVCFFEYYILYLYLRHKYKEILWFPHQLEWLE